MRDKCYICRNSHSNQIFFRSPAVVAILFVVFRRPCILSLQSIGPDLMNIDPSALQECIALYRIADPSPNTSSYYQSPSANPRIEISTQVPHFLLGHRVRSDFRRGRQTLLHSVEGPLATSTVISVLHPSSSQRGLGPHPQPQRSCQ